METLTHATVEHLEFEPIIPCEGKYHKRNTEGHQIEEPGAYYVISPCGKSALVQCKPRVDFLRKLTRLMCLYCQEQHSISDYRFIPLDSTA